MVRKPAPYAHVRTTAELFAVRGWVGRDLPQSRFSFHESALLPLGPDAVTVDHIVVVTSYTPAIGPRCQRSSGWHDNHRRPTRLVFSDCHTQRRAGYLPQIASGTNDNSASMVVPDTTKLSAPAFAITPAPTSAMAIAPSQRIGPEK